MQINPLLLAVLNIYVLFCPVSSAVIFVVVDDVVLQLKSAHKLLFMSPRPALGMANEAKDVSPRGTACHSASKCATLLCAERRHKLCMAK